MLHYPSLPSFPLVLLILHRFITTISPILSIAISTSRYRLLRVSLRVGCSPAWSVVVVKCSVGRVVVDVAGLVSFSDPLGLTLRDILLLFFLLSERLS